MMVDHSASTKVDCSVDWLVVLRVDSRAGYLVDTTADLRVASWAVLWVEKMADWLAGR